LWLTVSKVDEVDEMPTSTVSCLLPIELSRTSSIQMHAGYKIHILTLRPRPKIYLDVGMR